MMYIILCVSQDQFIMELFGEIKEGISIKMTKGSIPERGILS